MSGQYTEISHDCHVHYLSMSFDVASSVGIKNIAIQPQNQPEHDIFKTGTSDSSVRPV